MTEKERKLFDERRERLYDMSQAFARFSKQKVGLLLMGVQEHDSKVQAVEASIVRLLNEMALELTGSPYNTDLVYYLEHTE